MKKSILKIEKELLSDEELQKLHGGINVFNETTAGVTGLQGWSHCCNVKMESSDDKN